MQKKVEEPFLMDLIRAIVSGSEPLVDKFLADHPHLINTSLLTNADRGQGNTHFFDEIQHQLYIGDTALHAPQQD